MGQFEDMDAFVRIVEAGSISQAANQLGVVKSAVSRRLVDLEGRLGVQLLNRTTRQSSLTEAGRAYYQRSVRILADVAEINAATSDTKIALGGTLKISVPLTFGLQHLTPAINEFAGTHPDLTIHMDFNDRRVDLIEEGYDLAIRIADLKDSTFVARKLAPIRMAVYASPDYIARKGMPQTPEDLKGHDILFYANSDSGKWHFTTPNGRSRSITLPARMVSNNGDFLKDAAIRGHGIARSPTFIVWQELRAGKLQLLLENYHFTGLNAYAVYPETRHLPLRVRRFIDFLKGRFDGEPYWDRDLMSK